MRDSLVVYAPLLVFIALLVIGLGGVWRRQRSLKRALERAHSAELAASAPELPLHLGRHRLSFGLRVAGWFTVFAFALLGLLLGRPDVLWTGGVLLAPWVVEQLWEYRNPTLTLTDTMAIHRRSILRRNVEVPLRSVQSWGFSSTVLVLLCASRKPIAIGVNTFSPTEVERLLLALSALFPAKRDDAIAEASVSAHRVPLPVALLLLVLLVSLLLLLFWLFSRAG